MCPSNPWKGACRISSMLDKPLQCFSGMPFHESQHVDALCLGSIRGGAPSLRDSKSSLPGVFHAGLMTTSKSDAATKQPYIAAVALENRAAPSAFPFLRASPPCIRQ